MKEQYTCSVACSKKVLYIIGGSGGPGRSKKQRGRTSSFNRPSRKPDSSGRAAMLVMRVGLALEQKRKTPLKPNAQGLG